jgi:hypothetical protein
MLDVFVGESLAARTLRQADTFAECAVVGFAVRRVELRYRVGALNANRHLQDMVVMRPPRCSLAVLVDVRGWTS